MNRLFHVVCVVAALGLGGCASIVNGTSQVLSVITPPVKDANCELTNSKGSFYVAHTPGTISVHRAYGDMHVKCTKPGYEDAMIIVKSTTKKMAFGNILFGGVIGAGVDMANGAAYNYPEQIVVPMRPLGTPAAQAAPAKPADQAASTKPPASQTVAEASKHASNAAAPAPAAKAKN